jgi:hypothetical protein
MSRTGTVLDGLPEIATTGRNTRVYFPRPGEMTPPPTTSGDNDNKGNHETSFGFAYVNEIGSGGFRRQPFAFATGTMIVREKLLSLNANPERLVVMVKHEKAFNPKTNGWEFLIVNGDATKVLRREKNGHCLKCHLSASNNDFVFPEDGRYR